jgi:hypothetical protein
VAPKAKSKSAAPESPTPASAAPREKPSLHEALKAVHKAAIELKKSGLSKRAIVLLISDQSKVSRSRVEQVLDAILSLDQNVLDPADWAELDA